MKRKKIALIAALSFLACMLGGCLDFDEQTIYLEHDQQNDRLIMIINYRGIYAEKGFRLFGKPKSDEPTQKDIEESKEQLKKALETETIALLGNWPFAFPLAELRADLRNPEVEQEFSDEARQKLTVFFDRIAVRNAGFYTDAGGKASGAQVLIVEEIAKTLKLANAILNEVIPLAVEGSEEKDAIKSLWHKLLLEYSRRGHTWIELKGHSLIAHIPMPEEAVKRIRREWIKDLFRGEEAGAHARVRALKAWLSNPVFVWHEDSMLSVKCGWESWPSFFVAHPRLGRYRPNLADHISETYGLHLDENLARYLLQPGAAAESEAELAARTMAPRLRKSERIRVLVHQLKRKPSDQYWAKLREEELPEKETREPAELSNEDLLDFWQHWLQKESAELPATGQTDAPR